MPESPDRQRKPKRPRSKDPYSLRALGPGRAQVQVTIGYSPSGAQRRKSRILYGNDKAIRKQAVDFAAEHGQQPGTKRWIGTATTGEVLRTYIDVCGNAWAPKTLLEQRRFVNRYLGALDGIPANALTSADIHKWVGDLRTRLAPSSVKRILSVVKAGLSWAVDLEYIDANPATNVIVKVPQTVKPRLPSRQTYRRYIDFVASHDAQFGALLRLAVTTGARRGEIAGLRVSNINRREMTITFKHVVTDSEKGMVLKNNLKAGKFKKLSVDPVTLDAVLDAAPPSGFVFCDDDSEVPWRVDRITKTHIRWRKKFQLATGLEVGGPPRRSWDSGGGGPPLR